MEISKKLSEKARYDYSLVRKALDEKDQNAYAELMTRYRDLVYYMLVKMVKNKEDADDLTIEAFGKAFSRLHQYAPNYAFSTWLFKIASNNCIDFMRKKRLKPMSIDAGYTDEDDVTIDLTSTVRNPEQDVIYRQRILAMREVVEKLKPRYKTLIELHYFKEYSYEEISKELNIPIGTIKAQLFRAREFLQNLMRNTRDTI